ncbi:MAG TPA: MarR family transcriptional regulator [Acidimicrobiales bacterium]
MGQVVPEDRRAALPTSDPKVEEIAGAVLTASRVMVAIAARSLAGQSEDVTLPQFRTLVVLASRGPLRLADLADELAVDPSTATRLCDRLSRKRMISRRQSREDRREVRIGISTKGERLLALVTERRRAEIARIVARIPPDRRRELLDAFTLFGAAAGEIPDPDWSADWEF